MCKLCSSNKTLHVVLSLSSLCVSLFLSFSFFFFFGKSCTSYICKQQYKSKKIVDLQTLFVICRWVYIPQKVHTNFSVSWVLVELYIALCHNFLELRREALTSPLFYWWMQDFWYTCLVICKIVIFKLVWSPKGPKQ